METKRNAKIAADSVIVLCCGFLIVCMHNWIVDKSQLVILSFILLMVMIVVMVDLVNQCRNKSAVQMSEEPTDHMGIQQLILLDEQDKPIKSWDLSGKTAMVIGKKNQEEEVDVDLEDCEYSAFVDPEHAALNYCQDSWYIEDLGSQNGVKIRKVEDGGCYKVLNRPCRVTAGDIIYIANTRLLLT